MRLRTFVKLNFRKLLPRGRVGPKAHLHDRHVGRGSMNIRKIQLLLEVPYLQLSLLRQRGGRGSSEGTALSASETDSAYSLAGARSPREGEGRMRAPLNADSPIRSAALIAL